MKSCFYFVFLLLSVLNTTSAQQLAVSPLADETIQYYRPRVAYAADGSYAVAWEAQRQLSFITEWQIGVQRFSAAGAPVGATHYFEPESGCLDFDAWLSDGMQNVELAFAPSGVLVVLMEHFGEWQFAGDGKFTTEITLGLIDQNGQAVDLSNSSLCEQYKFIAPGSEGFARPRFAMTQRAELMIAVDGFIEGVNLRNVGVTVVDGDLNELVGLFVPHTDQGSGSNFHMWPDIASNGSVMMMTWHRCPLIDNQGNAAECDIDVQFATVHQNGALTALGGNQTVNAGDPQGTINIRPAAAMNASGNSIIVWIDTRTGGQGDIFGQRFAADGQPQGSNFQISQSNGLIDTAPGIRPEVALLDDGRAMIVWSDSSTQGFTAWSRTYDAGGNPEGPPQKLGSSTTQTGQPATATNGSAFLGVWGAEQNGSAGIYTTNQGLVVTTETPDEIPTSAIVITSYPNPVKNEATITYTLSREGTVTIQVFDLLGRSVQRLVDGIILTPGTYQTHWHAADLPAGLYLVQLRQGNALASHLLVH